MDNYEERHNMQQDIVARVDWDKQVAKLTIDVKRSSVGINITEETADIIISTLQSYLARKRIEVKEKPWWKL